MKTVHYGVNVKKSARVKKNIEGNLADRFFARRSELSFLERKLDKLLIR